MSIVFGINALQATTSIKCDSCLSLQLHILLILQDTCQKNYNFFMWKVFSLCERHFLTVLKNSSLATCWRKGSWILWILQAEEPLAESPFVIQLARDTMIMVWIILHNYNVYLLRVKSAKFAKMNVCHHKLDELKFRSPRNIVKLNSLFFCCEFSK